MSVRIQWEIFIAETRSDGTWQSNSPTLEELLNSIAGPEKIKEPTLEIEESVARLAIRGLPYFKIVEVAAEKSGKNSSRNQYSKTTRSKANLI